MRPVLYPYRRRGPPRGRWAIDRWLGPGFRLLEHHEERTAAPPALALRALEELRIADVPVVRRLFALRGLHVPAGATVLSFFSTRPFVLLEREAGVEFAGGVMVQGAADPNTTSPGAMRGPRDFERALAGAPFAALASFRAEPDGTGARLVTETWVRTRGALPAAAFGAYWLGVGPFSAWIRRLLLREALARVG